MLRAWVALASHAAGGSARDSGSTWIGVVMGLIVVLIGLFASTDFMGLPSRMHRRMYRHVPIRQKRGFAASFEYQRLIGLILVCGGLVTIVLSARRLI